MPGRVGTPAPTPWIVGTTTAAVALAAALGVWIRTPHGAMDEPLPDVEAMARPETALESAPDGRRVPIRPEILPDAPLASEDVGVRARRAAASLAASLDPAVFRSRMCEVQARALASTLGTEDLRELAILAADPSRAPMEVVAAAEILRHAPGTEAPGLPERALATLRAAWEGRESAPVLAAAAVRALGAFGDAHDRAAMLAEVTQGAPGPSSSLACAGLSAARGEEAVDDLVRGFAASADPRRAEVALSALTAIASVEDPRLSGAARTRCAAELLQGRDRSPRVLAAVAALDPDLAKSPLLTVLADATASSGTAQSAASALATMSDAEPELAAMLRDSRIDASRRTLAAEALLRRDADPWGEARSTLERALDGSPGTALERRAARVLERAGFAYAGL